MTTQDVLRNLDDEDPVRWRQLVEAGAGAVAFRVPTPDGTLLKTLHWVVLDHPAEQAALAAVRLPSEVVVLAPGEVALVAYRDDDGWQRYRVLVAESVVGPFPGIAPSPDDHLVTIDFESRLDDALQQVLDVALAPPPDLARADWLQQETVTGRGRHDVVERTGIRVTRAEWHWQGPDGSEGPYFAGEAMVAECATVAEAKARFHACVAELWRTAGDGEPDPRVVGVIGCAPGSSRA
jgi:hypothetical protein